MLLVGPISHTDIQYMDCVEICNISLDLSTIYLLVLVDVELPSCVVVTLSSSAITCFLESSLIRSFRFIFPFSHSIHKHRYQQKYF